MLKNVIAYAEICSMYANICKFLHMWYMRHIFRICDSKNAIMCRKICDRQVLAKYVIAYSHISNIPIYLNVNTRTYSFKKKLTNTALPNDN